MDSLRQHALFIEAKPAEKPRQVKWYTGNAFNGVLYQESLN